MKLSTANKLIFTLYLTSITLAFNTHAFTQEPLTQTQDLVKANNKYVTLLGTQVTVGEQAPNFKVVDKNFAPVQLSDFENQTILISVVPSLDTGVCSIPFAQKRFCKVESVDQIKVLSDSVWRNFGESYGLIIKDMGLLTRAIFIIDNQGVIKYKELVANISEHPDYTSALSAVKDIAPALVVDESDDTDTKDDKEPSSTKAKK